MFVPESQHNLSDINGESYYNVSQTQTIFNTQLTESQLFQHVVSVGEGLDEAAGYSEEDMRIVEEGEICDDIIDCLNDNVIINNDYEEYKPVGSECDTNSNGWTVKTPEIRECKARILFDNQRPTQFSQLPDFSYASIFKKYIDSDIIQLIVNGTNEKANEYKLKYDALQRERGKTQTFKWIDVTIEEMYAFISVLIYTGSIPYTGRISKLFTREFGLAYPRVCFTRYRFENINRFLRCDIKSEREALKNKSMKYPIVQKLLFMFQKNCIKDTIPSEFICIDERMCAFRGKSPSIIFNNSKPDKFGMEFYCLVDYHTKYCFGFRLYLGKQDTIKEDNVLIIDSNTNTNTSHFGQSVVLELVKLLPTTSHFTLCCDQLFTTFNLCVHLKKYNIDVIGTTRFNKNYLPKYCKHTSVEKQEKN